MTHNNNFFSSTKQIFYNRKYLYECALWRYAIRYASAQKSQLLKTPIVAISNIISNYIRAADIVNKILKVDAVQTIREEFPCADLVTYPIPNTSQRVRQSFHSRAHSVFCPIILTAKKATAVLYQYPQHSWATQRQGQGAEQALQTQTRPKVHHSGCSLLTYSAVLSFPWGRVEAPCSLHGFMLAGTWAFLILKRLVTEVFFQRREDKARPCQTARQFLWQLSTAAWLETINPPSPGQTASTW